MRRQPRPHLDASQLFGFITALIIAAETPVHAEPRETIVRVVDELGKPIAGAHLGIFVRKGKQPKNELPTDKEGWQYNQHALSDSAGKASIRVDQEIFQYLCLTARDQSGRLAAVVDLDRDQLSGPITLPLWPACRVSGRLTCRELETLHREVGWTNVIVHIGAKKALGFEPEDGTFYFLLPPGSYKIEAYGTQAHFVGKELTVKPGQRELSLGTIDLPAMKLALLEGQSAPELTGVVAWKHGKPVTMDDLRGKCVLLEFWGYWCGPCIYRMPELFALHDKYAKEGLVIIGVHVDTGEEADPVDTVAKLDEKLAGIRRKLWKDRDLPFPVALITAHRTTFGAEVESKARSEVAAEYGIVFYPTQVLIDRKGKVVGRLLPDEKGREMLEKALLAPE